MKAWRGRRASNPLRQSVPLRPVAPAGLRHVAPPRPPGPLPVAALFADLAVAYPAGGFCSLPHEVMLAVVAEVLGADAVPGVDGEAPGGADESEVVRDRHPAEVEEHVVIRAQAEQVPA